MNENLAIEIAKSKMREQGNGENYTLRVRVLLLQPGEQRVIDAGKDLFIHYNGDSFIRVESGAGIYDTSNIKSNELQFVHSGRIKVTNLHEVSIMPASFLQVIPLNQK